MNDVDETAQAVVEEAVEVDGSRWDDG